MSKKFTVIDPWINQGKYLSDLIEEYIEIFDNSLKEVNEVLKSKTGGKKINNYVVYYGGLIGPKQKKTDVMFLRNVGDTVDHSFLIMNENFYRWFDHNYKFIAGTYSNKLDENFIIIKDLKEGNIFGLDSNGKKQKLVYVYLSREKFEKRGKPLKIVTGEFEQYFHQNKKINVEKINHQFLKEKNISLYKGFIESKDYFSSYEPLFLLRVSPKTENLEKRMQKVRDLYILGIYTQKFNKNNGEFQDGVNYFLVSIDKGRIKEENMFYRGLFDKIGQNFNFYITPILLWTKISPKNPLKRILRLGYAINYLDKKNSELHIVTCGNFKDDKEAILNFLVDFMVSKKLKNYKIKKHKRNYRKSNNKNEDLRGSFKLEDVMYYHFIKKYHEGI